MTTMVKMMTLTSTGRQGAKMHHQSQMVARKEPRKKATGYPPIDRKLPVLYISRTKGENLAGPPHFRLD